MSDKTLKLEIVTPERVVLSLDDVVSVVLPGAEGSFGVMANHAPLMAELEAGELDFKRADGTTDAAAVFGGFVEVMENKVTVLAPIGELSEEIDRQRAEAAMQRAKERLESRAADVDLERAAIALRRALLRLRVSQRAGHE
jgi:F-type H+-transporting ATPase subunit epsilon